jgi:hypothetical protein
MCLADYLEQSFMALVLFLSLPLFYLKKYGLLALFQLVFYCVLILPLGADSLAKFMAEGEEAGPFPLHSY